MYDARWSRIVRRCTQAVEDSKEMLAISDVSTVRQTIVELSRQLEDILLYESDIVPEAAPLWAEDKENPNYLTTWYAEFDEVTELATKQRHKLKLYAGELNARAQSNGTIPAVAPNNRVQLPKLVLPEFHGEISEWDTFWASFSVHVHNVVGIPKVSKWTYLDGVLSGPPKTMLNTYPCSPDGYDDAVDALCYFYNDPERKECSAVDKLWKIEAPRWSYESILKCKLSIDGVYAEMDHVGIIRAGREPLFRSWIRRLIPDTIMEKILLEVDTVYPKVDEILEALDQILRKFPRGLRGKDQQADRSSSNSPPNNQSSNSTPPKYNPHQSGAKPKYGAGRGRGGNAA